MQILLVSIALKYSFSRHQPQIPVFLPFSGLPLFIFFVYISNDILNLLTITFGRG